MSTEIFPHPQFIASSCSMRYAGGDKRIIMRVLLVEDQNGEGKFEYFGPPYDFR
jgi:hypothetical protein